MKTVKLYGIDRPVSALALGTGGFGTQMSQADAFAQMDAYTARGGNFFDTACLYGSDATHHSESEKIIGRWFRAGAMRRQEITLLTKGCHPDAAGARVSQAALTQDLEASLQNMGTEYVDAYLLHRDDTTVPVAEILYWLEKKRKEGKLLNYGVSNWTTSRLQEAAACAKEKGYTGFSFNQFMWSLADINSEKLEDPTVVAVSEDMMQLHRNEKINAMAYTAVAKAYFTRRAATELAVKNENRYANSVNDRIFARLQALCNADYSMMDYALAFFTAQAFPALPVAAFGNMEQLVDGMGFLEKNFDPALLKELSQMKAYR